MKGMNWSKEIFKLVLLISITIISFILGKVVFENTHYSAALLGMSGAGIGLSLFMLKRVITFARNPESYAKERIDAKDERNIMLITQAKSSSYDLENFIIFGVTLYAVYLNNVEFAVAVLILWVTRIASFLYYLNQSNKRY